MYGIVSEMDYLPARRCKVIQRFNGYKFAGNPHMDQTRRSMLNEFDIIQQAVLESPDHNTVHVIYSYNNEDFVHKKLSLELKTRTGLQLVPPQSAVTTSLAKDGVLVVIVSLCGPLSDELLRKAVDTSGYPDTHTLFLQTRCLCPDWVDTKHPHCTLMIYPEFEVERQSQFWETLTRMITDKLRSPHSGSQSFEKTSTAGIAKTPFSPVLHDAVKMDQGLSTSQQLQEVDACFDELLDETREDLDNRKMTQWFSSASSQALNSPPSSHGELSGITCGQDVTGHFPQSKSITSDVKTASEHLKSETNKPTSDESDDDDLDDDDENRSQCLFCSMSSSSTSSGSSDVTSSDSEGGDSHDSVELDPVADCQGDNHTGMGQKQDLPSPIFSYRWQASWVVGPEGRCFRKPYSDSVLHVPPDAVENEVTVHTAICTDVELVRGLLSLSDDEEIVTPLVEYWTGPDFQFRCPVTVTQRHCLPPDCDPASIAVYHVTGEDKRHLSVSTVTHRSEKSWKKSSEEETLTQKEPHDNEENIWYYLQDELVNISTDRFCGFVCTFCQKKSKKHPKCPELYVMGSGSFTSIPGSLPHIDVSAHIWDRRIRNANFRQDYDIQHGRCSPIELLDELCNSYMSISLRHDVDVNLTERLDQHKQPFYPVKKDFNLLRKLGCKMCVKKGRLRPLFHHWAMKLEPEPGCRLLRSVEVTIDVTHWSETNGPNETTALLLMLPQTVLAQNSKQYQDTEQWRQQLMALDTIGLENMARSLDVSLPDVTTSAHSLPEEAEYREQLIQSCLVHGSNKMIPVLADLLAQTSRTQTRPDLCGINGPGLKRTSNTQTRRDLNQVNSGSLPSKKSSNIPDGAPGDDDIYSESRRQDNGQRADQGRSTSHRGCSENGLMRQIPNTYRGNRQNTSATVEVAPAAVDRIHPYGVENQLKQSGHIGAQGRHLLGRGKEDGIEGQVLGGAEVTTPQQEAENTFGMGTESGMEAYFREHANETSSSGAGDDMESCFRQYADITPSTRAGDEMESCVRKRSENGDTERQRLEAHENTSTEGHHQVSAANQRDETSDAHTAQRSQTEWTATPASSHNSSETRTSDDTHVKQVANASSSHAPVTVENIATASLQKVYHNCKFYMHSANRTHNTNVNKANEMNYGDVYPTHVETPVTPQVTGPPVPDIPVIEMPEDEMRELCLTQQQSHPHPQPHPQPLQQEDRSECNPEQRSLTETNDVSVEEEALSGAGFRRPQQVEHHNNEDTREV